MTSGFGGGSQSVVPSTSFASLGAFAVIWLLIVWLTLFWLRRQTAKQFVSPAAQPPAPDPSAHPPPHDLHCGRCGYSTTGLETFICPECGSDLRIVGIAAGLTRWSLGRRVLAGIYFTAVIALTAALLASFVDQLLPSEKRYSNSISITSASPPNPQFTFSAAKRSWSFDTSPMPVAIQLRPSSAAPASVSATYDPQADTFTPAGGKARPLNFDALLEWIKSAGVDSTDPQILADSKEALLSTLRASRVRSSGMTGMSMGSGTKQTFAYGSTIDTPTGSKTAVVLGMAILWYLGLRSLWRKTDAEPDRAFTPSPAPV